MFFVSVVSINAQTINKNKPTANAGENQFAKTNTIIKLNASNSTDIDGNRLSYQWQIISKPSGSHAELDNHTKVTPLLPIDVAGAYQIELVVSDGLYQSSSLVEINTQETKPIIPKIYDKKVRVDDVVDLSADKAYDPDGDILDFTWQLLNKPSGSKAHINESNQSNASIITDKVGRYLVKLNVSDGKSTDNQLVNIISVDDLIPQVDKSAIAKSANGIQCILDRIFLNGFEVNGTNPSETNSQPVASIGEDKLGVLGQQMQLDGSASFDLDFDTLTYQWSLLSAPASSIATIDNPTAVMTTFSPDVVGDYVVQLVVDDNVCGSDPDSALMTISVNQAPIITSTAQTQATENRNYNYQIDATDPENHTLTYALAIAPAGMMIDNNGLITWTALSANTYAVSVNVTDEYGAQATQNFDIIVGVNQAPVIESYPISSGEKDFNYSYQLSVSDFEGDTINYTLINPPTGMTISASGLISWLPDTIGSYPIQVQVDDGTSATDTQSYTLEIIALPPNPNDIALPLSKTEYTPFPETISFLYENNPPVQVGMPLNTIEDYRVAVITGKVLDEDNNPIRGIKVTINNHDEYGYTYTRDNGIFFMVVNGGGTVTVNFEKGGYLPVQRDVKTPWQEFAYVDDLIIVKLDDKVTPIDLTDTSQAYQVAHGNVVTDIDGTRQATVLFPAGITATMTMPDGSTQSIDQLDVRATEYTVGENGPQKMPADLPTGSAYTYAVELSVDQALNADATRVDFSQPVIFYLDDFIGFPQGVAVPTGWYDKQKAYWIPSDNGLVIKIIDIVNGQAVIDVTADDVDNAATQVLLDELGIDNNELVKLGQMYLVGKVLWRVPITHFTPWDHNWPYGPPDDVQDPPKPPKPPKDNYEEPEEDDDPCDETGCTINSIYRTLEERVSILGTNMNLKYRSQSLNQSRTIQVSGTSIPASLESIELTLNIPGMSKQVISFTPDTDIKYVYQYNQLDWFGRENKRLSMKYSIKYIYPALYIASRSETERIFAQIQTRGVNLYRSRSGTKIYSRVFGNIPLFLDVFSIINGQNQNKNNTQTVLGGIIQEQLKLGGWRLENHHVYDPKNGIIYQGDGFKRKVFSTNAALGQIPQGRPIYGHGGPAIAAQAGTVTAVANGANGEIYFAADYNNGLAGRSTLIRKVTKNGTVFTIAGNTQQATCELLENQNALEMCIDTVSALAVDNAGNVYFDHQHVVDGTYRIRKISRSGIVTTVAGSNQVGNYADNIPATQATLFEINHIDFDKHGNLYYSDYRRIRKVDLNGIITTIAGNGGIDNLESGILATQAGIDFATGFTLNDDGSLYLADYGHFCIRHVTTDGLIYKYFDSADCSSGFKKGLGGGAFDYPRKLQLDDEGNLIAQYNSFFDEHAIFKKSYKFGMSEILNDTSDGFSGDGGVFANAQFSGVSDFIYSSESGFLIADATNYRVRRVTPTDFVYTYAGNGSNSALKLATQSNQVPFNKVDNAITNNNILIPSRDGSLLYEFSDRGVHLRTIDSITAKPYVQFGYNSAGILASITDANGKITTISRDASKNATAFVSPYGKTTTLDYFADNRLKTVTDPNSNHWDFEYTQGLLTAFTDRNQNRYQYIYNGFGQLLTDLNPIGGGWQLTASSIDTLPNTRQDITTMTSGEGRISTFYKSRSYYNKTYKETAPDGTFQTRIVTPRSKSITTADGTITNTQTTSTYRLGNNVRFTKSTTTITPSGLTRSVQTNLNESVLTSGTVAPVDTSTRTTTINGQSWVSEFDQSLSSAIFGSNGGYQSTTPEGRTNSSVLNSDLDIMQVQNTGFLPTEITYDANRRVQNISIGTGMDKRETVLTYYDTGAMNGELHTITNAIGQTASFEYDNNGRITKQIMPDLREIIYTYDANGNLTSLTPPGRPVHNFDYTGMDQESQYTPPSLTGITAPQTQYTYNLDEQITQITRPDGQIITLNYNANTGKLDNKVTPTGTYSYGYDASTGKLNHITSPAGITLDYTFDGFLPLSTTWSGNLTGSVSRTYDNLFRVTSRTVNGTDTINYSYDNDNLLTTAGAMTISREVQKGGIINGTTLGNVTTANTFSDFAELASFNAQYSTADIYNVTYTRDKIGRISTKTETINGTTTVYDYAYDLAGRLIEEKTNGTITGTWTYDLNGNRTHVNGVLIATYDDQDRLLTYDGNSYTYTDNGELLTKTNGADVTTYNYDVLGNLLSVTKTDGTLIEYLIDPRGRRVGKKINGLLTKGWLYKDKLNPIAELDASGNIVSRFIYGDRGNIPSYMVRAGVTYRIITNQLGSPLKIVDVATGTVVQEMSYDVWGNVLFDSNPKFQPFGFAGGIYDGDTQLTRFGYRDYDVVSARWTSKDPIELFGGINTFGYSSNNPIDFLDINGLTESQIQCVCDLARNENKDLPIPFEKYNIRDLGDDVLGNYDSETDEINISNRYKEILNLNQLIDLFNTWVHEGIHRRNHKKDPYGITDLEPREHVEGDKIYKEADERADNLWNDLDKRKKLESCQ